MFDLGDITALPSKKVLRISDVFVSHTGRGNSRTVCWSTTRRFAFAQRSSTTAPPASGLRSPPDETPQRAWWRDGSGSHERHFSLGSLKAEVLQRVPGEKICYVTDVAFHQDNVERIAALAGEASQLFIECTFLEQDADHAARKMHLAARQAGSIARAASARLVVPFHFSPRYAGREAQSRAEVEAALAGSPGFRHA